MDPGNWATDLAGGARYGYTLLSVIMLSNLMAILLQALAARLGIASGRDLAQACRDSYSRPTTIVLWIALRDRDRRLRPRRSDRRRDRAQSALRSAADLGRRASPRSTSSSCCSCSTAASATSRRSSSRLILAIAGSFAIELVAGAPGSRRRRWRASSRAPRSCATPTCSTSRSASSARR